MGFLLSAARCWLVFLALFELPEIYRILIQEDSPHLSEGVGSNLHVGGAERRAGRA